ncbi:NmrA/HSCARG family protein [Streptomyces sp. NPDC058067]|uniref:NmrA/HSCARG family protein n=1 Tax=Streptomyces sp. NPDC058067 TaxID=3346324 RepID=UPI0036E7B632
MTVTVLGATGGQGGAVVTALLESGYDVRAVARDPGEARARILAGQGVDVVRGDLADADSLADAFRGASAAFAVTTPFEAGLDAEDAQGLAIVEAARRTDLPHLVFASVASADRHTGIPHFETKARAERILADSGVPATVVAPSYFYDNVFGERDEIAAGVFAMPLPPDMPLQQVSRRDLGLVVAAVIADRERFTGRRIEVAGDDPTPVQMAAAIGRSAGRSLTYRQIPLEEVRAAGADMGAMYTFLAETGYQVDLPALRAEFPQIAWTSFEEWAAAQHWPGPRP